MNKHQFGRLLHEIGPHIETAANCPNYRAIPTRKKLALTLYYLADTVSLVQTANTFGVDRSTASKIVRLVCSRIYRHLTKKCIKMPATHDEMEESVARFARRH